MRTTKLNIISPKYTASLDWHLSSPTILLLTSAFCFNFSGVIINLFFVRNVAHCQIESKSVGRSDNINDTFEIVLFSKH